MTTPPTTLRSTTCQKQTPLMTQQGHAKKSRSIGMVRRGMNNGARPESDNALVAKPSSTGGKVRVAPILPPGRKAGSPIGKVLFRKDVYRDLIYVFDDFLSIEECNAWVAYGEKTGFLETFHPASFEVAHRDNGRIQFESPATAGAIFERIWPLLPAHVDSMSPHACASNIRLYRYGATQRFGKHIDESHRTGDGGMTVFTLLLYLNDEGLRGGETTFYKGNYGNRVAYSFAPKLGAALLHGHGSRCLLHEGQEVKEGYKYVLRTDVIYRAK